MTPAEKAGQPSQYFYISVLPPQAKLVDKALLEGGVGSLLFVSDPAEANRLQTIATEYSRLNNQLLLGFDVIHGLHTIFLVPLAMPAWGAPTLVEHAQMGIA